MMLNELSRPGDAQGRLPDGVDEDAAIEGFTPLDLEALQRAEAVGISRREALRRIGRAAGQVSLGLLLTEGALKRAEAGPTGPVGPNPGPSSPVVGDIVVYFNSYGISHSGGVIAVSGGKVTKVMSKWGGLGLYKHAPSDVPPNYGGWSVARTGRGSNTLHSSRGAYSTDKGHAVMTYSSGKPGFPPLTVPDAQKAINSYRTGLYDLLTPVGAPTWAYDCHGFTFTGGAVWINDTDVPPIISDNGYKYI